MLVPQMTSAEIYREVIKDSESVQRKVDSLHDNLRRTVIKTNIKRILKIVEYTSPRKNNWLLVLNYTKKQQIFEHVVYYLDDYGLNGMMIMSDEHTISHYTPHFLARYEERFLKTSCTSKKEILKNFVLNNHCFVLKKVSDIKEMNNCFLIKFPDGIGLGYVEKINNIHEEIFHLKTFITDEMIHSGQIDAFEDAVNTLQEHWIEMQTSSFKTNLM